MNKADFYVGIGDNAEWIGSVSNHGDICSISPAILIQTNQVMYEEVVIEYINYYNGVVASHKCQWPWYWADSRMTEYSYIFIPAVNKVCLSVYGCELLDPIKILQGETIAEANTGLGVPSFPIMIDPSIIKNVRNNGPKLTAVV